MKTLEYTLFCWPVEDGAILGQLLNTDTQMVARDLRRLRAAVIAHIEKALREGNFYEPDLGQVKMKTFPIHVRPAYRADARLFPAIETLELPVHAVFGKNSYGYFECFLPQFRQSFYLYDEKDLKKLVEHYSRDILQSLPPHDLYNLLLPATPWIETLPVKVPPQKQRGQNRHITPLEAPALQAVAERLPYLRAERRPAAPAPTLERRGLVQQGQRVLIQEKTHVLLVGKSGVGKSAIIEEAIRKQHSQEKSQPHEERHSFWRSNPGRIIARAKYLGEWQEICEDMVEEMSRHRGILWLENFVMLLLSGGEGPEDSMAAFLLPAVQERRLRIVSELSPEQLEAVRRLLPGFAEHFRIIRVDEMDMATSLRLGEYYTDYAAKNLGVQIDLRTLQLSYALLDRFLCYESFPGKLVRFLQRCVDSALLARQHQLPEAEIIRQFSLQTGLPDFLLRDDILLDAHALRAFFISRIKGQEQVVDHICSVIKVFKTGLNDPGKPVATLLFAGPTGVGKTAMARAIASYFFGAGQGYDPLIRLDMSEFQHSSQIYRLIGTEGKLVQQVRERPFCVVLFDEIEKAHPLIFDALLTVMDEGTLIDAAGRVTDFRNAILIMTSNLGSVRRSPLGFRADAARDYTAGVRAFFRPEFYNRIDAVLPFRALDPDTIREITLRELGEIMQRDGILSRKLTFDFTEALGAHLARTGFDEKYGARPLQREIEQQVVAPLARLLVDPAESAIPPGSRIQVDWDGSRVVFHQIS